MRLKTEAALLKGIGSVIRSSTFDQETEFSNYSQPFEEAAESNEWTNKNRRQQ